MACGRWPEGRVGTSNKFDGERDKRRVSRLARQTCRHGGATVSALSSFQHLGSHEDAARFAVRVGGFQYLLLDQLVDTERCGAVGSRRATSAPSELSGRGTAAAGPLYAAGWLGRYPVAGVRDRTAAGRGGRLARLAASRACSSTPMAKNRIHSVQVPLRLTSSRWSLYSSSCRSR